MLDTGQSAVIQATYEPGFTEAVFRKNKLLTLLPQPVVRPGDTSARWKVNSSGNTAAVFSEGDGAPGIGNQTWVDAAVSWLYLWVWVQVTGHMSDALQSNFIAAADEEFSLGRKDLVDLLETSLMGSTYGLEVAVDSTSTYAGIARGSASYWESTETTVSGPLSRDRLEVLREGIIAKGGTPGLILCGTPMATNFYHIGASPVAQVIGDGDKAPGLAPGQQYFAETPVVSLPGWSTSVLVMLDTSEGNFRRRVQRPFTVHEPQKSGDSHIYEMSYAEALMVLNPKNHGKLASLDA